MSQQPSLAPLSSIVQGRNPRTFFDPDEMTELEESVASNGIIQPILLRPFEGKLQIVAGERRYRAALKVLGESYEIPCLIKEMTDAEADEFALVENIQRADMAPTEEAVAASKILARYKGDREEAARRLGWSTQTLDKRLALMNCSDSVRKALNERKIQLGHAELLATTTREQQDKALEAIIKNQVPVASIKQMLSQVSKSMASAIFDKTECAACPHNSDLQTALFSESVGAGSCTNAVCFDKKSEAELAVRCVALKDDFPRVEIVRPGDQFKIIKIVAEGATGVGEEQAIACRACTNFGAVVSAAPDKMGRTFKDQCFDTACNSLKVASRIKAEQASPPSSETKTGCPAKGSADQKSKSGTESAPVTSVQDSTRVKDYRLKVWRKMASTELFSKPDSNSTVLIALGMAGQLNHVSSSKLSEGFGKLTNMVNPNFSAGLAKAMPAAEKLSASDREKMTHAIASSVMFNIDEHNLVEVLKFLEADLKRHWKLNAEFLDLLTKSEIEVLCAEVGLKSKLGEKFPKIMGQKKDEIIKALLAVEGFDYGAVVPKSMQFK